MNGLSDKRTFTVTLLAVLLVAARPAVAEETTQAKPALRVGPPSSGAAARSSRPKAVVSTPTETPTETANETIALEVVAKAPKPIPPVELDMLQLRLSLSELKRSFTERIESALYRSPF